MKQQNKQTILVVIIALVSLNFCCKKDLESETLVKPSNTLSERKIKDYKDNKTYINSRLDKTAKIIASLSRYKQFRKVVNEQVAKKFDGDYNVLLKDLIQAFPKVPYHKESSGSLISSISTQTQSIVYDEQFPEDDPGEPINNYLEILRQDVETPYVVNEETIYPQIYIPFFGDEIIEYDPCSINASAALIPTYSYPVVVPYDGDETTGIDVFNGYTYDANGLQVPCGNVSECFAKRHEVWAVTINERPGSTSSTGETTSGTPLPSSSPTMNEVVYIPSMVIKSHKETWIKGSSEIAMKYGFSWSNGINPTTNAYDFKEYWFWTTNPLYSQNDYQIGNLNLTKEYELFLGDFSRNQIKKDKVVPINFTYNFHLSQNSGAFIYLVIYEKDYLGSLIINGTNKCPDINGVNIPLYYVSNDGPYLTAALPIITKNEPNPPSLSTRYANINNSEITFISQYR